MTPTIFVLSALASLPVIAAAAVGAPGGSAYGPPISIDQAKKAAAAAAADARANNWAMAIAVVDPSGMLVYFEKLDGTQNGSVTVAIEKARTAALFKRPTRAIQDAIAAGGDGLRFLAMPGATPIEGGLPVVVGGKIVGAIGVSGGTSAEDGQAAAKGIAAVR